MKTKILPILTTAFTLLCAACSDDSTSNAITGNDDDHGSVIAGKETVNTFETPGTGKEYDWGGEISESITSDFSSRDADIAGADLHHFKACKNTVTR